MEQRDTDGAPTQSGGLDFGALLRPVVPYRLSVFVSQQMQQRHGRLSVFVSW